MADETLIGSKKLSDRIFATIIDYGLTFSLTILYVIKVGHQTEYGSYQVSGLYALVPVIFWFLYFPVVESVFDCTLGHWLMNLRVIRTNGTPIEFIPSVKRHLLDPIDFCLCGIPAMVAISKTPKHQRLGDMWADTIVVKQENDKINK
ncbi:MAG: RDD family protein [Bacteroidia bacterium]